MRDKVLGFGWPFSHEASSNSTRSPRLFDWTNDPEQATVDVAVYLSHAIRDGVGAPGRKLAWILESPEIARWQRTTPFIERNLEAVVSSYEAILTSDREFCKLHPKIVYHPAAANLPWIREDQYAIYSKTKLCSMFASNKKMVAAHHYRRKVAARLKDQLDLFGGASGSPRIGGKRTHPDKTEGMLPYMFQIVMENAKADLYYTEKITDCFATGTVPIYWGSSCIGELFDTDGIIEFDEDFDINSLSADLYYAMMPAIRHNFRLVQDLEGTDDLLFRRFIRPPADDDVISPWIPGTWAAEQVVKAVTRQRKVGDRGTSQSSQASEEPLPWAPWDAARILAAAQTTMEDEEERLRIVTEHPKESVPGLESVPATQVTVRSITSQMVPPKSISASTLPDWPPQLTKAFLLHLGDAFIGDNVIFDRDRYYSMDRWWLGRTWRNYTAVREVRHIEAGVSVAAWGGEAFQHFIFDALPVLASVIDALESPPLAHLRIVSHNEPGGVPQWFWKRLGLTDRIVSKPANARSGFVVHADLALYPQFEPNLRQLGFYPRNTLRPIQRRLGVLDRVERDVVLYLRRGAIRSVANEEALLCAVRKFVESKGLSLEVFSGGRGPGGCEEVMKRSRVVFGPHGGAFANLIFAQPGTHVIEFVPLQRELRQGERHPLTMYYGMSQAAGLDYWFVEPDNFGHRRHGMVVDVNEVVAVMRRVLDGN